MTKTERFKKVEVTSAQQLRRWLESHHGQTESVWLVTLKKHTGATYVSREEVLDELICYGWIDGIRRKLDDDRTMQLISPRKAQHWALTYKERAVRLEAEGRMRSPGLRAIEESKRAGLWDFMDDVDALKTPGDLRAALEARPDAARYFEGLPPARKRFALRWIKLAKKPETRRRRIETVAELSSRNEPLPGS
jgi:uncharacterized protein YdeI (YjbR/CyaY-like superfamily)